MEHKNVAQGPPWLFWNGGPNITKIEFDINTSSQYFECMIFSPILSETQDVKNQIDSIYSQGIWDDYKKITNPYEYIFLSLSRRMSRSVAVRTPLSRSYFKMLELWDGAELSKEIDALVKKDGGLISAHAAEGPGGFIESLHNSYKGNVKYSQGMTLRSTTRNIPGWRKTSYFLNKHPTINITYGKDGTGDLLNIENIDYFVDIYGDQKAHIYTADGGFDFSSDFNAQEETILPLLTAEFYLGLKCIQRGGVIVVKIFDTTLRPTLELIWLVTRSFREWSIVKPRTSRGGNAERYFIGKGFIGLEEATDKFFRKIITHKGPSIKSFLKTKLDPQWTQILLAIQEAVAKQEITIIQQTLNLVQRPNIKEINAYIEQNVERSIQWCKDHNEAINQNWYDAEWRKKTVQDEIKELTEPAEMKVNGWRGLSEASLTAPQEPSQQKPTHHAVTFARSRSSRAAKASSKEGRSDNLDEEGWQKV
jgi:23S rRNA U2552 (ribose-2'-O)-methylase RlmE/FtsJ